MRVDNTVHEAPAESKGVDQDSLGVLLDHKEAEEPDQEDADDIGNHTSFVADPVDDLSHEEGSNHLTGPKNGQGKQTLDQLLA